MRFAERIETERLVLRVPELSDADAVFGWASDPQATRLMSWPRHRSLADTRAFLHFARGEWERWPAGPYLIELASTGQPIGSCGFVFLSADTAEVGYILSREQWGRGLATEALANQLDAAEMTALRVTSTVHRDNVASMRVLEKCHFALDDPAETHAVFPNLGRHEPQPAVRMFRVLGG
jgi:ribosomal-protein-alanine N-acetyltransferase